MFKEKEMIHFYKSILTLLCKYYGFILFKWVSVVVFAVELQIKCSIQSRKKKKKKKSNLTEEKEKTQFTTLLTLYFLDFSLFSFFLMDSKSIYLLKLKHFQTPVTFGSMFCSPEMTKQGPHYPGIEVRHILYKVSVNSNCNIS